MGVGIELRGTFSAIYGKLQSEAWKNKGITVEDWIKKERIKRIEEVEMEQFGERKHGIDKCVIKIMLNEKDELHSAFLELQIEQSEDRKNFIRRKIDEIKEDLKTLSLSVTVGKTKHSPEFNSIFAYDIISKYFMLKNEQILSLIRIATEEDFV